MELKRYLEILWKRRWLIAQSVLTITAGAIILSLIISPVYKISARVLISPHTMQPDFFTQDSGSDTLLPRNLGNVNYFENRDAIETYIALAASSPILEKVIKELDLRDKKGHFVERKKFVVGSLQIPSLLIFQKKGVTIKRLKAAEMLEITGYSGDREEAAKIANSVTSSFSGFVSDLWHKEASSARKAIEEKLMEIETTGLITDLIRKNRSPASSENNKLQKPTALASRGTDDENETNLQDKINILIAEISRFEMEKEEAQHSLQQANLDFSQLKDTLQNKIQQYPDAGKIDNNIRILNYKQQLFDLEKKAIGLQGQLSSGHREMKFIKKQINTAQKDMKNEISGILLPRRKSSSDPAVEKYADFETSIVNLSAKISVLSRQIEQRNKELLEKVSKSNDSSRFESRLNILSSIYNSLRTRLEFAKLAETMDISNIVTVQEASLSEYRRNDVYFPKKGLILTAALFMGLISGIFLCFLLEYLDDKVNTAAQISERLNQPVLGIIAYGDIYDKSGSPKEATPDFYGSFWNVRSKIKIATQNKKHALLCVTSAGKNQGKSVFSKYFSHVLAESAQKVLIMDMNLRRPYLHLLFGRPNSIGLSTLLEGKKEIKDIIFSSDIAGIDFIPAGQTTINPLKLIDSPAMLKLIESVKEKYDFIVLDSASIDDGSDVAVISSFADYTLLVVAMGTTSENRLKKAIHSLQQAKGNILGVILNERETWHSSLRPRLADFRKILSLFSPQDS